MIELTTGVAFLLTLMYGAGATTAVATASQATPKTDTPRTQMTIMQMQDTKAVEKYIREQYADTPILAEIARCESGFSQLDKEGKVVRGIVNPLDVGVMQINEKYHLGASIKMGLDIHTVEGNVAYAKYLYENEGGKPWKASQPCWGKKQVS